MQCLPLLDGGGLVQVLVLIFQQFLLHWPQFPQTVQPPATRNKGAVTADPFGVKRFSLYLSWKQRRG